jgi:hypothetical protein
MERCLGLMVSSSAAAQTPAWEDATRT